MSWQYDIEAMHQGKSKVYIFVWKGRKIAPIPTKDSIQSRGKKEEKQKVLLHTYQLKRNLKKSSKVVYLF